MFLELEVRLHPKVHPIQIDNYGLDQHHHSLHQPVQINLATELRLYMCYLASSFSNLRMGMIPKQEQDRILLYRRYFRLR